jgi:tRNA threonylcarbamoyladenosine biosynthesis protein TsaE
MSESMQFEVADLEGTRTFGRRIAELLFPGAVVALIGQLGAGKTHFVKAIAEGLDIANPAVVNSPTFVLIQEYDARLPIFHFDAYRLVTETEFADLGPHEYFVADGVSLIEWADKVSGCLPAEYLEIRITATGETSRRFEVTSHGQRYATIVAALSRPQ